MPPLRREVGARLGFRPERGACRTPATRAPRRAVPRGVVAAPLEDAVRSPELRRGGRRMVITATKRAGWWIPLGLAGSLLWVGAKVLVPLAARAAIDDGFSPYDSTAI